LGRETRTKRGEVKEGPAAVETGWELKKTVGIVGNLQDEGISHLDEGGEFFEGDRA
jgi:hypothetical protein